MVAQSRLVLAALALAVAVLAYQQPVAAKPRPAAKGASKASREREAKTACLSGEYSTGVSLLAALFVETNDPAYLYNQGRCYEQNVRYVEAAERFREYLRKAKGLSEDVMAEVNKHIADCEAAVAKSQPHPNADSTTPPPASVIAPPPSYTVPADNPALIHPEQPAADASSAATVQYPWQHTAKWIAAGAAVAFLGLGVVEHVRYYTKNRDFNDDPNCSITGQCKDLADAADTAQLVSIVGYSAAVVATGLAVTFWLTDTPKAQTGKPTRAAVACSPTLVGAFCAGRF